MEYKRWNADQELYLEGAWGIVPIKRIKTKLNKSEDAIKIKASKLKLGGAYNNNGYLLVSEVAEILGKTKETVNYYIKNRGLKTINKTYLKRRVCYIEQEILIEWLVNNDHIWNSDSVNKNTLIIMGMSETFLQNKVKSDLLKRKKRLENTRNTNKIAKLYNAGYTYQEIADNTKMSYDAVKYRVDELRKQGLVLNNRTINNGLVVRKTESKYGWTTEQDETLVKLRAEGKTLRQISLVINKPYNTIKCRWQRLCKRGLNEVHG